MYSIPQTLLSGQTLLSKRCYDPHFLVVAIVEGRQYSKVGSTSLRMAEIIASNGPVSPIRPRASIHPRPEHDRGSCDIYVDPDPKT
jgi:hypothetical protein